MKLVKLSLLMVISIAAALTFFTCNSPSKRQALVADKPVNSGASKETSGKKPQYYIRSSFENSEQEMMKKLEWDTTPNIAIEAVGWSKNGLFAYRYKHYADGAGGWVYSFAVINTINDKIIESDEIYPDEFSGDLSKKYKAKWNSILEKHDITGRIDNPIAEKFKNDLLAFPVTGYLNVSLDLFGCNMDVGF